MSEMQLEQRIATDRSYLNEVAEGFESYENLQHLNTIESSMRTYLLGALYQEVAKIPEAQEAGFGQTWQSLVELQQHDPTILNDMLTAPATGSWLVATVSRLRTQREAETMLATDIGFLGNIAAGFAAQRKSVQASFVGSAHNGRVHIPELGTLTCPVNAKYVAISVQRGALRIVAEGQSIQIKDPQEPSELWQPVWRYTSPAVRHDQTVPQLHMLIDDANPYHSGLNPYKLDTTEYAQWCERLGEAWQVLLRVHPQGASELANGLHCIVPKPPRGQFEAYSSSSTASIGSIEASLPANGIETAEILLHEYGGHSKLNKILRTSKSNISYDDLGATLYAPWRDDPRPSGGVLHGVYSFSRVAEFYSRLHGTLEDGPQADLAAFEYMLWRDQTASTLARLKNIWLGQIDQSWSHKDPVAHTSTRKRPIVFDAQSLQYTPTPVSEERLIRLEDQEKTIHPISDVIFADMLQGIDKGGFHGCINIPVDISRLVTIAILDHRALWRAHHVQPDEAAVQYLVDKIGQQHVPLSNGITVESKIVPDPSACRLDERAIAMRHYLKDRAAFAEAAETSPLADADRELILGNIATAHIHYQSILREDPLHTRAFVGALLSDGRLLTAARPDLRMPHVLLALQRAILNSGAQPAPLSDLCKSIRYIKSHSNQPGM